MIMKNSTRIFCLAFLLQTLGLWGQNPILINLNVSPPYSPYLNDYINFQGSFGSVTNTSAALKRVKFRGKLEGDNGYYLRTKADFMPPQPVLMNPGQMISVTTANIKQLYFFNKENVESNKTADDFAQIAKDGVLPEGVYTLCIQAFDYDTDLPISANEPQGCATFTISYVSPPMLTKPLCNTSVPVTISQFAWSPPVGNTAGAQIRYDLYVVEVPTGQNPQDLMESAYKYNAGNPMVHSNLIINSYNWISPADIALKNNSQYVWMVVAKDLNHKIYFEHEGKSEACVFTYSTGSGSSAVSPPAPPAPSAPVPTSACVSCTGGKPSNQTANTHPDVIIGSTIFVAGFEMTVTEVAVAGGKVTGKGTIPMPLINDKLIKIRVEFSNITVNTDSPIPSLIAGTVKAIRNKEGDPAFVPAMEGLASQAPNIASEALSQLKNGNNVGKTIEGSAGSALMQVGFNVPFGTKFGDDALGQMLAFNDFRFTDKSAEYDAYFSFSLQGDEPLTTPGVTGGLAFKALNVCFSKDNIFCGAAYFLLAQDFTVHLSDGGVGTGNNLRLKGGETVVAGVSADNPTHVKLIRVNNTTHISFNISAEYEFDRSAIVGLSSTGEEINAKLRVSVNDGISWGDWIASVTMTPFKVNGADDFVFNQGTGFTGYYDHSTTRNPSVFTATLKSKYPECASETFEGFYLTQLNVGLPTLITSVEGNTKKMALGIKDLIIPHNGKLSVDIEVTDIVDLEIGKVDTWGFAVDRLYCSFRNGSFNTSGLEGRIQFPFSLKSKEGPMVTYFLKYTGTFGYTDPATHKLNFKFSVNPEKTLDVSIWYAHMELLNTSTISVAYINDKFDLSANLNGRFFIKADSDVPFIGNKEFTNFKFEQFQLTSKNPIIKKDEKNPIITEKPEANETKVAGGFPLFIDNIALELKDITHPGLSFRGGIKLSSFASALPAITAHFIIKCALEVKLSPLNVNIGSPTIDVDEICLGKKEDPDDKVTLGPFSLRGCLTLFHADPTYGNGFAAQVTAGVAKSFEIQMYMRAGNMPEANGSYDYFGLDALATFNPGIPFFPGTSLYGFGGGGYYNMNGGSFAPPKLEYKEGEPNVTSATSSQNFFTPVKGNWGMKATIVFGLSEKTAFNGSVTLRMGEESFNTETGKPQANGVKSFYIGLDGQAQIITSPFITNSDGLASGTINTSYIAEFKLFTSIANVEFSCPKSDPIIKATANIDIYFRGDGHSGHPLDWHIRVGRPQAPVDVQLLNPLKKEEILFNLAAYFEVGNHEIDPMPPPPAKILEIFNKVGQCQAHAESGDLPNASTSYRGLGMAQRHLDANSFDFKMITGARFETSFFVWPVGIVVKVDYAGLGFDLALQHYTTGCYGNAIGANGWYVNGQVYAGLELSIGVGVMDANVNIAGAGLAALAEFGGPNPTWVTGEIAGYIQVGPFTPGFSIGLAAGETTVCVPGRSFGDGVKLITRIIPADKENNNYAEELQDLTTLPLVQFHAKVGNDFWFDEIEEGTGTVTKRHYRLFKEDIKISLKKKKDGQYVDVAQIADFEETSHSSAYSIYRMKQNTLLDASTDYIFRVEATMMEEISPNNWQPAVNRKNNNSIIKEIDYVTFRTKDGIDEILPEYVDWSIPFQSENYFNYQQYFPKGQIKLKGWLKGLSLNTFKVHGNNPKLKARWVPMGGAASHIATVRNCTISNGMLQFDMPQNLLPNTYYVAQIYIETDHAMSTAYGSQPAGQSAGYSKGGKQYGGNSGTTAGPAGPTMQSAYAMEPWQQKIFEISFKTSRFVSPDAKLQANTLSSFALELQILGLEPNITAQYAALQAKSNRTAAEEELMATMGTVIGYLQPKTINFIYASVAPPSQSSASAAASAPGNKGGSSFLASSAPVPQLAIPTTVFIQPDDTRPITEICEDITGLKQLRALLGSSAVSDAYINVNQVKRIYYTNTEKYSIYDFGMPDDDSGGAILFEGATCYQELLFLSKLVFNSSARTQKIIELLTFLLHTSNINGKINQVDPDFHIFASAPIQPEAVFTQPDQSTTPKQSFSMDLNRLPSAATAAYHTATVMEQVTNGLGSSSMSVMNNMSVYKGIGSAYDQVFSEYSSSNMSGFSLGAGAFKMPQYPGVNASFKSNN